MWVSYLFFHKLVFCFQLRQMLQDLHISWLVLQNYPRVQDPLNHFYKNCLYWLLLLHDECNVLLFIWSFRQHCNHNLKELESFLLTVMLSYFKKFNIFCYYPLSKPRLEILFYFSHQKLQIPKFLHPHSRGLVNLAEAKAETFSCFKHTCENHAIRQIFHIEYLFLMFEKVFGEADHGF